MKYVSLFSPGLDSFLSDWVMSDVREKNDSTYIRCYFNINVSYSESEIKHLKRNWCENEIIFISNLDLAKVEEKDFHVPQRNLLFCVLAQSLFNPDKIILSGVLDDRVSDNDNDFRILTTRILSKTSEKTIDVISPLGFNEKSKWVKSWYLENKNNKLDIITKTFSCFNPLYIEKNINIYRVEQDYIHEVNIRVETNTHKEFEKETSLSHVGCLSCTACFRRICALTAANIYLPFYNIEILRKYKSQIEEMSHRLPNRATSIQNYIYFYEKVLNGGKEI